jgi:hypothetical protein
MDDSHGQMAAEKRAILDYLSLLSEDEMPMVRASADANCAVVLMRSVDRCEWQPRRR